ncbi:OsmC family protein [Aquibacillus sediminis]|uniref:OsmC family protein n=1 Tax=Aquibacillus sediminis TaxID=2574734 RepID=UPI001109B3A7|nr:OsmC family protein [Aquibacillus sediminis]
MQLFLKETGFRMAFPYGNLEVSGNEDYGFRPYELMIASIAGCSASVFRKELDRKNIEYDDISVTIEYKRNPEQANRIEKIELQYIVKGPHLDDEKLYNNLDIAHKNCSMIRSVEDSIEIQHTLESIEITR